MKSAIDVIASVQSVRLGRLGIGPLLVVRIVTQSLASDEKRDPLLLISFRQPSTSRWRPGLVGVEQVHRRDHVQEHPVGEEPAQPRRAAGRGDALDPGTGRRSPRGRRPGSPGRRRMRRPASGPSADPIGQESQVRLAHRLQRLLAALALGRTLKVSSVSRKQRRTAREEELLLRSEEAEEVGCEIPARSAIVSVDVPWKPVDANSPGAASRIASRRSSAVMRVAVGLMAG